MIFELSKVFRRQNGLLPQEPQLLGLAITGSFGGQHWGQPARPYDFYDLAGALEMITARLRLQPFSVTVAPVSYYHPGKSALITRGEEAIGAVGEIHPAVLKAFDLSQPVLLAEIDFDRLLGQGSAPARYRQVPRFPAVSRDLSIIVDTEIQAGQIVTLLRTFHPELLREVYLFDVYAGTPVPVGRKSLTFALIYRADDRTLIDQEVNSIQTQVVQELHQRFGAQLRGYEGENGHGGAGN
jgi:phenylalanyl-tRNA synthetase beta chain